ncbi:MAG: hypothetical protein M1388_04790 [Thaumarchaeota archaeon]|nr:hypothetical protein [Nitrososphaerota archaeon]
MTVPVEGAIVSSSYTTALHNELNSLSNAQSMLNNTLNSIQPSTATMEALSSVSSAVNDMGVQIYNNNNNNIYLISITALVLGLIARAR